jgi:hypothetical protein
VSTPEERRTYNVGAVKIEPERRDVAHEVITPEDDRGFFNIIGADDDPADGHTQPIGSDVTYRVELTEAEAERFRQASNARYVTPDTVTYDTAGSTAIPRAATLAFLRATFGTVSSWHGRDVLIGMLDGGTTAAVRSYLDATMVARKVFGPDDPGVDEITSTHGCKVAPCLIPVGGRFLDAIVSNNAGVRFTSSAVAAATWCADQGAKIINYSGSGPADDPPWADMFNYLAARNVQFFASAGNDGAATLGYPAAYSTTFANCHSSISFDEVTNTRSSFSNHSADGSGCAPGSGVLVLTPAAAVATDSGTSFSSPHMARLCAMGATGGKYTPAQVGAALKANTRNTGQSDADQGHGAYSLEAALTALGAFATTSPGPTRKTERGPRLKMLTRADVGPNGNRADGTGPSLLGTGGGTTPGVSAKVQAAQAILDRIRSGQPINADWTWTGMPAVVSTNAPTVRAAYTSEGSPAAQPWLQAYITSGGVSGLGTGGGAAGSIGALLKWGTGTGMAKFDIGIGFAPGDDLGTDGKGAGKTSAAIHRNYSNSMVAGGFQAPGYFELTPDGTRCRMSAHLDGAPTTKNTQYPRVEPREYDIDGTTKMAFNPNKGTHYLIHRFAVKRMPPDKPELCTLQWHDAGDDVAMVRYRNKTTVEAKLGDTVLGNLTTSAVLGTIYTAMIKIIGDGTKCKLEYYWQDMATPKFTTGSATRSTGWYGKAGCYAQSNSSIDAVEDGPFIVETLGLGHWHSQSPLSSSPWPEPVGLKP